MEIKLYKFSDLCEKGATFIEYRFTPLLIVFVLILLILASIIIPWKTISPTEAVYDDLHEVLNTICTSEDLMQPTGDVVSSYKVHVLRNGTTNVTLYSTNTDGYLEATINSETFEVLNSETKSFIGWIILIMVLLAIATSCVILSSFGLLLFVICILADSIADKIYYKKKPVG